MAPGDERETKIIFLTPLLSTLLFCHLLLLWYPPFPPPPLPILCLTSQQTESIDLNWCCGGHLWIDFWLQCVWMLLVVIVTVFIDDNASVGVLMTQYVTICVCVCGWDDWLAVDGGGTCGAAHPLKRERERSKVWGDLKLFLFFWRKKQGEFLFRFADPFYFLCVCPLPFMPSSPAADSPPPSAQWHYCRGSSRWRWRWRTATTPRRDAPSAGDWPSLRVPARRRTCPAGGRRSEASGRPSARRRMGRRGSGRSVRWGIGTADQRHPFPARRAVSWRRSASDCASPGHSRQKLACLPSPAHALNVQNRTLRGRWRRRGSRGGGVRWPHDARPPWVATLRDPPRSGESRGWWFPVRWRA